MRKPNLFIVGAQKSGTTWLHRQLSFHPETFMSHPKELFFFSKRRDYAAEMDDYLAHFADAKDHQKILGESSTSYFWIKDPSSPWCGCPKPPKSPAELICKYIGTDIKIIITLRNPIDRAVSAFYHHWRSNRVTNSDRLSEIGSKFGVIDIGMYHHHLQAWLQHLERGKMQILHFENDIKDNPQSTLESLFAFLGIDQSFQIPDKEALIAKRYGGDESRYRSLVEHRFFDYNINHTGLTLAKHQDAPIVTFDELRWLRDIYEPDIQLLCSDLGWDAKEWLDLPEQLEASVNNA